MKKLITLAIFLLIVIPVSAKQLYEYGSFEERAEMAVDYGVVDYSSQYYGNLDQNILLLNHLQGELLGFSPSTGYFQTLTTFISKTASTINVNTINDRDGIPLVCSATNKCYFNLEPGTEREESTVCNGTSGNAVTGCIRGLVANDASNETASTTIQFTHSAGSSIIQTDIAQFYGNYMNLWDDQTATGTKKFVSHPQIQTYVAPTADEEYSPKKYVDDTAISGSPDATQTVKGIVEIGTPLEIASSTPTGGTGATTVIPTSQASSTIAVRDKGIIPATQNDGFLDQNYLDLSENFAFTGEDSFSSVTLASTTATGKFEANRTITEIIDVAIDGSVTPKIVAFHSITDFVVIADADNASSTRAFGFITTNATASSSPNITVSGVVSGFTALTINAEYYLSDTAGEISRTQETRIVQIGTGK